MAPIITSLGLAIFQEINEIIKILLEIKVDDLNAPAFSYIKGAISLTPLRLAILTKNSKAVAQLISYGADTKKAIEIKCSEQIKVWYILIPFSNG